MPETPAAHGLPHASGMGAARRYVALLAAQPCDLARPIRSRSRRLGRVGPHARPFEPVHIIGRRRSGHGRSPTPGGRRAKRHAARYPHERCLGTRPWTVVSGRPPRCAAALVHWGFNAWGRKYPRFDLDQRVPERIAETIGYRRFEPGIILEGGAVDFNGRGAVLTTEQCVLHENRNPGISQTDIERHLADYCAVRHVIWLGKGIVGDDTDGHIDEVAARSSVPARLSRRSLTIRPIQITAHFAII